MVRVAGESDSVEGISSLLDLQFHVGSAGLDHVELFGRSFADVEDAAFAEGAAIVDPNSDAFPIGRVAHLHDGPEREGAMRRSQPVGVVVFTGSSPL